MRMKRIKPVYEPYWKWEDFQYGMYDPFDPSEEKTLVSKAVGLLGNPREFRRAIVQLVWDWPLCSAVNLTNPNINRRAWLGQATCCFVYSVPELLTRTAWKTLSNEQRLKANRVAEEEIERYEEAYRAVYRGVDIAWLLGRNT